MARGHLRPCPRAPLLLTGEDGREQAYRAGDRAWGMQFHAEVTPAKLDRWVSANEAGVRAWAAAHLPAQIARFRALFTVFVRLMR